MKQFNPRHLRKKFARKNGDSGKDKQRAFRKAALWSKRFINQPASELEKPKLANDYAEWCRRSRAGSLR